MNFIGLHRVTKSLYSRYSSILFHIISLKMEYELLLVPLINNSEIYFHIIWFHNVELKNTLAVLQLSLFFNKPLIIMLRGAAASICLHLIHVKPLTKLITILCSRNSQLVILQCFINIIMNWYSKLNTVVRWGCVFAFRGSFF